MLERFLCEVVLILDTLQMINGSLFQSRTDCVKNSTYGSLC